MPARNVPAYLVVGDDPYLASRGVAEVLEGAEDLEVEEFGPEAEVAVILQAVGSPSMFGDRRVVVLRDVEQVPAEAQRRLAAYVEAPHPGSVLVLVGTKVLPALLAAVRRTGRVVEAGRGRRSEVFAWLRGHVEEKGLRATGEGMSALVDAVGSERMALAQAVEQLALALGPGGRIGPDEVRRQFREGGETSLYGFLDAVATRQRGAALEALHGILRQGESPHSLLWSMVRHFRTLLLVPEGPAGRVAEALRVPGWLAEKLARQAKGFPPGTLVEAYRALAKADHTMKTGEEPDVLTLERVVLTITR